MGKTKTSNAYVGTYSNATGEKIATISYKFSKGSNGTSNCTATLGKGSNKRTYTLRDLVLRGSTINWTIPGGGTITASRWDAQLSPDNHTLTGSWMVVNPLLSLYGGNIPPQAYGTFTMRHP
ncbi:hypothetical protein M422DRAFT_71492 [Sphaerobolus stellatus SS14]|uniref:Uncharacterized protein n=1 Tax=Sphaerobolus stellatus (strain SS14) TaxID=990650 RepID=A0A0C9UGE2_SPHS4|nr:hypothetical protein M422DRAFT_71492 [Sphaerobolus stellatus SS14]